MANQTLTYYASSGSQKKSTLQPLPLRTQQEIL